MRAAISGFELFVDFLVNTRSTFNWSVLFLDLEATMDYEAIRLANIQKNNDILASLGLDIDVFTGPPTVTSSQLIPQDQQKSAKRKPSASKKRVVDEVDYDPEQSGEDEKPSPKVAKTARSRPSLGSRRSARHEGKDAIDYAGDSFSRAGSTPKLVAKVTRRKSSGSSTAADSSVVFDDMDEDGEERPRHKLGKRTRDPKTFGHIPGVPIGKTWEMRWVHIKFRLLIHRSLQAAN